MVGALEDPPLDQLRSGRGHLSAELWWDYSIVLCPDDRDGNLGLGDVGCYGVFLAQQGAHRQPRIMYVPPPPPVR